MFRKTILVGVVFSLASTPVLAAPTRVAAPSEALESLSGGDESAWMLPVGAILISALIILIDSDGGSDFPTSP